MRHVLSLAAAAALLVSASVANANVPLTLTDSQLDKVTAGGPGQASSPPVIGAGVLGPEGPLGPHGVLPGATH